MKIVRTRNTSDCIDPPHCTEHLNYFFSLKIGKLTQERTTASTLQQNRLGKAYN